MIHKDKDELTNNYIVPDWDKIVKDSRSICSDDNISSMKLKKLIIIKKELEQGE